MVFTSAAWRLNVQGGADLEVIDAGRTYTAHAVLVQDADEVADAYATAIRLIGWKAARRQLVGISASSSGVRSRRWGR